MATLSAGKRLKCGACATEIMVISAPDEELDLMCGGNAMNEDGSGGGSVDPNHAEGTAIGKRYVNEDGSLEVLCVKAGEGSLSLGDTPLAVKDAKKLPKTD